MAMFGLLGVAGIVGGLAALAKGKRTERVMAIIFLLSLFFTVSLSAFLWQLGILPKLVQFPWRFLTVSVWSGSFLAAYGIDRSKKTYRNVLAVIILGIMVFSAVPLLQDYQPVTRDEGYYATNEDTTTTKAEYMPIWVKKLPDQHPSEPVAIETGSGEIQNLVQNSNRTQFGFNSRTGATIVLRKIYYPGWEATVNGKATPVAHNSDGYVSVRIPSGESTIHFSFGETPLRLFADLLSCGTGVILVLFLVFSSDKRVKRVYAWYNTQLWKRK